MYGNNLCSGDYVLKNKFSLRVIWIVVKEISVSLNSLEPVDTGGNPKSLVKQDVKCFPTNETLLISLPLRKHFSPCGVCWEGPEVSSKENARVYLYNYEFMLGI
jgi:hypothetical protein